MIEVWNEEMEGYHFRMQFYIAYFGRIQTYHLTVSGNGSSHRVTRSIPMRLDLENPDWKHITIRGFVKDFSQVNNAVGAMVHMWFQQRDRFASHTTHVEQAIHADCRSVS